MIKIITINVNGIRSAHKKGIFDWLYEENPDIICMQEIKADMESIPIELQNWQNYHAYFHPAVKKGYSGVAIYSKITPQNIIYGIGDDRIDNEGRYLRLDFEHFSIISLYLPSGSSGEDKQKNKFYFMECFLPILKNMLINEKKIILCGDFNIAHNNIDIKNWKANSNKSGFLPEERQWLSQVLDMGFIDIWRTLYPNICGYTWWSNRGNAYQNDVGWRIDYQICSPNLLCYIKNATIYKTKKFSDHAPLIVNYEL
jgi:exodeoxyribonuclease-3